MRLIDADALIVEIREYERDSICTFDYKEIVRKQPTIEPKIIRCKDCKYWDTDYGLYGFCGRHGWHFTTYREGYCYMADKRHVIGGKHKHETN